MNPHVDAATSTGVATAATPVAIRGGLLLTQDPAQPRLFGDVLGSPGPADRVNSTAQAYETLRSLSTADLAPGQIVSQVQLAAELNVSRTPLREALRRLQSEGLLEGDFNRRLRVAPLTVDDLEQVAAMRIMPESFGVQSSVPVLTATDLARAGEAFDAMDAVWAPTGSFHEFTQTDRGSPSQAIAAVPRHDE